MVLDDFKVSLARKSRLECLENVLHRSCGKENRARAYLRRALNVESDGQELENPCNSA